MAILPYLPILCVCEKHKVTADQQSRFSQMHNIDNNGINANNLLPYLPFSSLFTPDGVSKCEIIYLWVLEVCILK